MKKMFIIAFSFLIFILASEAYAQECVSAYDFGRNSEFIIPANPDENNSGTTRLITASPSNQQVAPWIPTRLTTIGGVVNASGYSEAVIRIYVDGKWAPWGGDPNAIPSMCGSQTCDSSNPDHSVCLTNGIYVKRGSTDPRPCYLTQGMGLYGLIAINFNGVTADPNSPTLIGSLPTTYFRTFRVDALQTDREGRFFADIRLTNQCQLGAGNSTVCLGDTDGFGKNKILSGSLYFKILDKYYLDNTGGYNIQVVSGVVSEVGPIQSVLNYIKDVLNDVTQGMYQAITGNNKFKADIRALLVLYATITGFMFMTGLMQIHQSELVIRLLKVGILSILISPASWDFFNTYIFSFISVGALEIADYITVAAFQYSQQYGEGGFALPPTGQAVALFDNLVLMIVAPAIHKKIAALLLYKWYFVYILWFYLILYILLVAIFRSVVMYLTSMILVAILLVIAPIFIAMLLFKFTKDLFDAWLKQIVANGIMMIVVAASLALMVNLIFDQLQQLLYYRVCWDVVWSLTIKSITLFDVYFWKPTYVDQLDRCITAGNFFSLLLVAYVFDAFMQRIPTLIDSLSNAGLMPISTFTNSAMNAIQGSAVMRGVTRIGNAATAPLKIGGLVSMSDKGYEKLQKATRKIASAEDRFERSFGGRGSAAPETKFLQSVRNLPGKATDALQRNLDPRYDAKKDQIKDYGIFD